MAKRRRHRRFGSPPETHKSKASHAFLDARHHAGLSSRSSSENCRAALRELLTAKGALEEGLAHVESGGNHEVAAQAAKSSVVHAEKKFTDRCLVR